MTLTLNRLLSLFALWALSTVAVAQTCPAGNPRVAPDSRYTIDSANGVVTDLATGLMWKRCSEGQSGASCATGTATGHTWAQALTLANASTHAGFSDWRLPNREELRSLVETACFSPSINTVAFPATLGNFYWSSTTYAPSASFAWNVIFDEGVLNASNKGIDVHRVRLVRGGQWLDPFASEADSVPDAFSLTPQTGVPLASERTSDPVTVAGLTTVTGIGVSGAAGSTYSINGGPFTAVPGSVANGDQVRVRHTSAAAASTNTTTTLTIGGVTANFVSTTAVPCITDPVVGNGNDSGAGSLRQAIADACAGSTIAFQTGITTVSLTSAELSIGKSLSIEGATGVTITRAAGSPGFRILSILGGNTVSMNGLTISNGNATGNGGGILNQGSLTLTNSTLSGNSATNDGGGLHSSGAPVSISGSTLSGNTAGRFAGAVFLSSAATLRNCTVAGNTAPDTGGLGFDGGAPANLTNCSVAGNSNTAIVVAASSRPTSTLTLVNTLVAIPPGSLAISGVVSLASSNNLIQGTPGFGTGGMVDGVDGNVVSTANPRAGSLGNFGGPTRTLPLLPGSPAINAGTASGAPATDQRGIARVGTVDIGAFESRGYTLAIEGGNNQTVATGLAFAQPLAVRVAPVAAGEPVAGGAVSYTAPGSGASATLASNPAVIDAGGVASTTATANTTTGAYSVSAAANGASPSLTFALTNQCPATVVTNGNDSGAGSLRQVIADACVGSTITFAPGVNTVTLTTAVLFSLKTLTIDGGATRVTITRSTAPGTPDFGVIYFESNLTLSNLIISNGRNPSFGGGVRVRLGNLLISDSIIRDNAVLGGAQGGGISIAFGSLTMNRTLVEGNQGIAAGIYVQDADAVIAGSTVRGNSGFGGGVRIQGGGNNTLTMTNSTISGNTAANEESAIRLGPGQGATTTVNLINCIIANNTTTNPGWAAITNSGSGVGILNLTNTIVSGNLSGGVAADSQVAFATSSTNNLIGVGSGLTNGVNGNIVGVTNPRVSASGDFGGPVPTVALLPGSPAINAGSSCVLTANGCGNSNPALLTDQRGIARVGAVDIGAFESRGFTLAIEGGNNQVAGPGVAFAQPLAVRVTPVAAGEPVAGGAVSFTPPGSGASAVLTSNPAVINAGGVAATAATASASTGSYLVSATANGASAGVDFALRNVAATVTIDSVTVTEGNSSTTNALFTVTRSNLDTAFSIGYATASGTATAGTDFTATSGTLNFAAGPSEPLTQTISVSVIGDRIDEANEQYTLTLSNIVPTVGTTTLGTAVGTGTITDDDTAGSTVTPTAGLTTTEAGGTATFTVVLASQPTADVSIGLSSNDTTEGTVSPTSLTFTSANWNTARTVTVTGVEDLIVDGNVAYTIVTAAATSTDLVYAGINAADVSVTNNDNDVVGVTFIGVDTGNALTENNISGDSYSVQLTSAPASGNAVIVIDPDADCEVSVNGSQYAVLATITTANPAVVFNVIARAVNDRVVEGAHDCSVSYAFNGSTAPEYASLTRPDDVYTVNDDDTATFQFVSATGNGPEASTPGVGTVEVVFATTGTGSPALEAPISVGYTVADGTASGLGVDYTLANGAVVIPTSGASQTIGISIVNDAIDEANETLSITLTAAETGGTAAQLAAVTLGANAAFTYTIVDDDTAGVGLAQSDGSTTVTEGGATDTYTLVLTGQPTADVTVAVNPYAQLSVSPTSVTFTGTNWNTAQTVTVTAVDDAIAEGSHSGSIAHVVTSADTTYNGVSADGITATITDNDNAGVTVTPTAGLVTTEAGGTATFTVVLNSQPSADVSIGLSSSDTTEGSVAPISLSFTAASWNVAQNVTVTGVDDLIVDGSIAYSIVTAPATSADNNYNGLNPSDVSLSNSDNDTAAVTVVQSGGTTAVTEGGTTDSYTVVLSSQPSSDVTIALTGNQVTTSPTSLTFTAVNWATAQTVTVTAIDDAIDEVTPHAGSVTSVVSSGDANYNGSSVAPISVAITDNDTAGITVTPTSGLSTTEAGGTANFSVVLSSQPTGNVSIGLSSSDTTEGTVASTALSFTAGNWNVAQTVTVTGVDDLIVDGAVAYSIVTAPATSSDANYSALNASDVGLSNSDNDTASITVVQSGGTTTVTEGGATDSYTLVLSSQPTSDVSIALTGSEVTTGPTSLVFTSANWATAQTVTVTAIDDAIDEATPHAGLVTSAVTSSDTNYNGSSVAPINVAITDNDSAGISVTPTSGLSTTEAGGTANFSVVLDSQPTGDVTIGLTSSDTTEGTVAPTSMSFTSANWNIAQTVTVTGIDDGIVDGAIAYTIITAPASSSDANYNGVNPSDVSASNSDNDNAGVTVVDSSGSTAATEGGATDSYTVVLTSQPTADVAVVLGVGAQVSLSPSNLTFTAANWNVVQTVTVTATDDAVVEGAHGAAITHSTSSSDPNYSGIAVAGITVDIGDNDSAVVSFAPANVSQAEGTSPMVFTVTLSAPVVSGVSVTVNSANATATAGADYTAIAGQTLSFVPGSTTAQTVSVAISNDALDEDDESYTLALSDLVATGDVTLGAAATGTIEDDDALPTLSVANVSQPEGNAVNTLNFTVNLSPVSGRAVSFTRETVDGSAISTAPNADFQALAASVLTIPAGQTSLTIPVTINGDTTFEGDQSFGLSLTAVSNATPGSLSATATLTDDDQQPTTTTITAHTPDPTVVGQPYTVSVNVAAVNSSPLGTVTISDGAASCGPVALAPAALLNSTTSCALTSTTAGAKNLVAIYAPESTAFAASTSVGVTHQVNAAVTAISVSGPPRSRIDQPTSFAFALSVESPGAGSPAGTVTLSSGASSCNVTVPTATPSCALTFSTLGSRAVSAAFAPSNGNFAASSSSGSGNTQTMVFARSDMAVTKSNGVTAYAPGDLLVYTVTVRNLGADAAANIRVVDTAPAGLTDVVWSCDASGGVACPQAGGSGNVDQLIATFPVGGLLNYTFFGNVLGSPAQIVNTASVVLPADATIEDLVMGNNNATDTDLFEFLLSDGFESVAITAPNGLQRLPAGLVGRASASDAPHVVLMLDDAQGEAVRVYAREFDGQLQLALAQRVGGALRLGPWQAGNGQPEVVWSARPVATGWVLDSAVLR